MSEIENPLAFPIRDFNDHPGSWGMSLRDYFASQAIGAILSHAPTQAIDDVASGVRAGMPMARAAYTIADAMLNARKAPRS